METTTQENVRNRAYSAGITIVSLSMLGLFFTAYKIVTPHLQFRKGSAAQVQQLSIDLLQGASIRPAASAPAANTKVSSSSLQKNTAVNSPEKNLPELTPTQNTNQVLVPSSSAIALTKKYISGRSKGTSPTVQKEGLDTVNKDKFVAGLIADKTENTDKPLRRTSTRIGVNLNGRNVVVAPEFLRDTKDEGTVVVEITVNKAGEVIEAIPNGRGTTTSNAVLRAKATQAAKSTKFNADERFEEQKGTLTIVFSFN